MRLEGLWQLQLEAHQFGGFIGILVAAVIAVHGDRARKGRRGVQSVRFAQRDFVPEEQVLLLVVIVIFANHYPDVIARVRHKCGVSGRAFHFSESEAGPALAELYSLDLR